MEETHYLYLITRDDGEQYVGVTNNPKVRFRSHYIGRGSINLKNRVFTTKILCEGTSEYLYSIEPAVIKSFNCSLNIALGGKPPPRAIGQEHPKARLKDYQVLEIIDLLNNSWYNTREIADMFGVKTGVIGHILHLRSWTHLSNKYGKIENGHLARPELMKVRKGKSLSTETVEEIIKMRKENYSYDAISNKLNVSKATINKYVGIPYR